MPTVILVAYHFPPAAGSSGLQRTLRFAQYLPEFGWKPIVLTVEFAAYNQIDERSLAQIPPGCEVVRAHCLDARRHLSIRGRYPRFAALPDRWASWQLWAARAGERLVRERGVNAVWSTYPIATAHKIGASISRRTGIPWIADFRDPMAQDGYPPDPRIWQAFKKIEETAATRAARLCFVSPSARQMYVERYQKTPSERFVLLENGFDEQSFDGLSARPSKLDANGVPVLLHSGIVYPSERDPNALFEALGRLAARQAIQTGDFVIRFRASVHEALLHELAIKHKVSAFVDIQPPIPYREALQEMLEVQALVIMQGANCNGQIPAKLYEYLRAERPILSLTDPAGDTGSTLATLGYSHIITLESADAIERALPDFLLRLRAGSLPHAERSMIDQYSRRALTGRFAALLDEVVR